MKKIVLFIALSCALHVHAQTKDDTVTQVRAYAKWFDLDYTAAESDSLLNELKDYLTLYRGIHRAYPKNDLTFPFAFQPAPYGFTIPVKQAAVNWNIPA